MFELLTVIVILLAAAFLAARVWNWPRVVVIREFEMGLLYFDGRFVRQLHPGRYRFWRRRRYEISQLDTRLQQRLINGQEVLSRDNVSFKVSLLVTYQISDPVSAIHTVTSYGDYLHSVTQLALREAVSAYSADEVLEHRESLGATLTERVIPEAERVGLRVEAVHVRDVMLPAEVRQSFAEVLQARNEGRASLERARGETAALRNLANGARSLEENPALFSLRMLQSIGQMSQRQDNSLVVRLGEELMQMHRQGDRPKSAGRNSGNEDASEA